MMPLVFGGLFFTGCATLMNPGPSFLDVEVDKPAKACKVTIRSLGSVTGERDLITRFGNSFVVELSRNADYRVSVESDGYHSEDIIIRRSVRPVFFANCCVGGIIGMGIDFFTGSMWEHSKDRAMFKLEPIVPDGKQGKLRIPLHVVYESGRVFDYRARMFRR